MFVAGVMSKGIIAISPEATLEEAVERIIASRVSGRAVMDREEYLLGILAERHLLRRSELATEHKHPRRLEFFLNPERLAEYSSTPGRRVVGAYNHSPLPIEGMGRGGGKEVAAARRETGMSGDLAAAIAREARLPERASGARSRGTGRPLSRCRGGPPPVRAPQARDRGLPINPPRSVSLQPGMPGNLDAA